MIDCLISLFKTKYQRVTLKDDHGKGGFYDTLENVKLFLIAEENPEQYEVSKVIWMSKRQYKELHEFTGF